MWQINFLSLNLIFCDFVYLIVLSQRTIYIAISFLYPSVGVENLSLFGADGAAGGGGGSRGVQAPTKDVGQSVSPNPLPSPGVYPSWRSSA